METYFLNDKSQINSVKRRNKGKYFRTRIVNRTFHLPLSGTKVAKYELKVYDSKPRS